MSTFEDDRKLVAAVAKEADAAIQALHARSPDDPTFEQVGLLDGIDTVVRFLDYNELGCALMHLLYMIHEADIVVPRETVVALHAMAERIGEHNHYAVGAASRLTPEQRARFFNALD